MPEQLYEEILEQCIGSVLAGASINACVARYPDVSADLREDLEAFTQAFDELDRQPSWDAIMRSRQRLVAEIGILEQEDAEYASGPSWLQRLRQQTVVGWRGLTVRQRVGGAFASFVVFALLAGVMLIAASTDAIPGDTLYATKRAVEDARLNLAFSDEAKADLQLTYAGHRAQEASKLITRGEYELATETARSIETHLARGASLAAAANQDVANAFAKQLTAKASTTLTELDAAVAAAPSDQRVQAVQAVSQASSSYAQASEKVALPPAVASSGTLEFWAADPPPPGVSGAVVQVRKMEAYLAAGDDSRWLVIVDRARSFDLVEVAQAPELLGSASVEAGTYTRFRFLIDHVSVTARGSTYKIKPNTEQVELQRPFWLEENGVTPIYFDFDGDHSLKSDGNGGFSFWPVVAARSSVQPNPDPTATPTSTSPPTATPTTTPTATATPVPSPTPTASPTATPTPARITIDGTVQRMNGNVIVLEGGNRVLTNHAIVPPGVAVGSAVTIIGTVDGSGALVAEQIVLRPGIPTLTPTQQPPTPTPTATPEVVNLSGVLVPEGGALYAIGETTVRIPGSSEIVGDLQDYASVDVTGVLAANGTVVAASVTVVAPPETVQVRGLVVSLTKNQSLLVAGQAVRVTPKTAIDGTLEVGGLVDIIGVRIGEGSVIATSIRALPLLPTPTPTPTPPPSVSPTATPPPTATPTPTASPTSTAPPGTATPTATPPPIASETPNETPSVAPSATPTSSPSPTPPATPTLGLVSFVVEGPVLSLPVGPLFIEGLEVQLTPETAISGELAPLGGMVRAEGYFTNQGQATARSILVL